MEKMQLPKTKIFAAVLACIPTAIFLMGAASEFIGCYPHWRDMCGTMTTMLGIPLGFGLPALGLVVIIALEKILPKSILALVSYPITSGIIFAVWFTIGIIIAMLFKKCGYIYSKLAHSKTARILFFLVPVLILVGMVYRYSPVTLSSYTSQQSCEAFSFLRLKTNSNLEYCYLKVAEKLKDPSICDLMRDNHRGREDCLRHIAADLQDFTVCDRFAETLSRDHCINMVAHVRGECEKLSGPGRDYCYQANAASLRVSARDNRCDLLRGAKSRELCEQHRMNMITTADLCDKIIDTDLKSQCMNHSIDGTSYKSVKSPGAQK